MKKMNEKDMRNVTGGKTKRCGGCGKKYRTWITYTYHMVRTKNKKFADCLAYVCGHPW